MQNRFGISEDIVAAVKSSRIVDIIFRLRLRDVHSLEITESIVEQRNRIFIIIRVLILHHHADQLHAVLLRTGDQGASRHIGITGLTPYQVGICVFSARDQFHLIDFHDVIRLSLRRQNVQHVRHGHLA